MIFSDKTKPEFKDMPLPNVKNENYKYSNLNEHAIFFNYYKTSDTLNQPRMNITTHEALGTSSESALITINSKLELCTYFTENQKNEIQSKKIKFTLLSSHESSPPAFKDFTEIPKNLKDDPIAILCTEYAPATFFLHIPENTCLSFPIKIETQYDKNNFLLNKMILVEENSRVDILEIKKSDLSNQNANTQYLCTYNHIILKNKSSVNFTEIEHPSASTVDYSRSIFSLFEKSTFFHNLYAFGGQSTQKRIENHCIEKNSEYSFNGIFFGTKKEKYDLWLTSVHDAPYTKSTMEFHCLLHEQSQSIFNGTVNIPQNAPFCEAHQKNNNILISTNARAVSLPKLIISTDEVVCSHGATTSPIDEEQIYYLQSRGIPRTQAEHMILIGYWENQFNKNAYPLTDKNREEIIDKFTHSLFEGNEKI